MAKGRVDAVTDREMPPKLVIFACGRSGPHQIHGALVRNDISIGLSAFVALTVATNKRTRRQTTLQL